MKNVKPKPPRSRKLSAWLNAALDDYQVVQRRKNVRINHNIWLEKSPDGKCAVCLMGSTLLRRGVPVVYDYDRRSATPTLQYNTIARAIDNARKGFWFPALERAAEFSEVNQLEAEKYFAAIKELCALGVTERLQNGMAPTRLYRRAVNILRKYGI